MPTTLSMVPSVPRNGVRLGLTVSNAILSWQTCLLRRQTFPKLYQFGSNSPIQKLYRILQEFLSIRRILGDNMKIRDIFFRISGRAGRLIRAH